MTLTLHSRAASPFGRKVLFAATVLGLADRMVFKPADDEALLRSQNPLAKIPVLLTDDGEPLYDSRVILEYLDGLAGGGKIIPAAGWPRFEVLRRAALADGILEAALLVLYERRYRPDVEPYAPWLDFQRGKIARGLAAMADDPPGVQEMTVDGIGLACGLEYMDFRHQYDWRAEFPALVAWLDDLNSAWPDFAASRPTD